MRSRSNSLEDAVKPKLSPPRGRARQQTSESHGTRRAHKDAATIPRNPTQREQTAAKSRDLSRDDLLFLLSMLEGELQVTSKCMSDLIVNNFICARFIFKCVDLVMLDQNVRAGSSLW